MGRAGHRDPGRPRKALVAGHHRVLPTNELTPAEGGVLLAETVRDEHRVAWLLGAAANGYLDIEIDRWLALVRRERPRSTARTEPWTQSVLDDAFGGRDLLVLAFIACRYGGIELRPPVRAQVIADERPAEFVRAAATRWGWIASSTQRG